MISVIKLALCLPQSAQGERAKILTRPLLLKRYYIIPKASLPLCSA